MRTPQITVAFAPMLAPVHGNKVDHDPARKGAQADLSRDLGRRLQIRVADRIFQSPARRVGGGVHIDDRQGFRPLDHDLPAGRQLHARNESGVDFLFHLLHLEQRLAAGMKMDARQKLRRPAPSARSPPTPR